ncbi:proline racemase family protein, partial [Leucobacter soli]
GSTWVLLVDEAGLGVEIATTDSEDLLALVRGLRAEVLAWLRGSPAELGAAADEAARHLAGSPIAIVGRPAREDCEVRTFVGFGERSIDRSPCGTAVSALIALRATDRLLQPGQWLAIEGVSGERFDASIAPAAADGADDGDDDRAEDGRVSALIRGRGFVTGVAAYEFDAADPFAAGFAV